MIALSIVLLLSLCLPWAQAHVEFAFSSDVGGDDGFLTFLKVPHGCILSGPDNGTAPESDVEAATSTVQITVPADFPVVVAGFLPFWNLSRVLIPSSTIVGSNITIFTYTAQPGYELITWQALAIPFIFSTPNVAVDTTYVLPVVQSCVGGYVVQWMGDDDGVNPHPAPTITITAASDPSPSMFTTIYNTHSSASDQALSICAIILAGIVAFVLAALVLRLLYSRPNVHQKDNRFLADHAAMQMSAPPTPKMSAV